jgi:hypothetical protein
MASSRMKYSYVNPCKLKQQDNKKHVNVYRKCELSSTDCLLLLTDQ